MKDSNKLSVEKLEKILCKQRNSEPLTDEESAITRELLDDMMKSHKTVQKTVKMVTGEELRKSKVDSDSPRKDDKYKTRIAGDRDWETALE